MSWCIVASTNWSIIHQKTTQPEIHLRADKTVPYGAVAETLADAAKAGLSKIGFVTQPDAPAVTP